MRRVLRFILIFLMVAFVAIQFFQPERNTSSDTSNHFFTHEEVPANIKTVFENACMDCHSDNTNYLWYHRMAPVSWMVNKHVVAGRDELNFSEWGAMDLFEKIGTLEEICRETERKTMPLKPYVLMHPKAKLTDEQVAELCDWTTALAEKMLADAVEN